MNPREPEPLWRSVVGDPEPWRRGRLFLVVLASITFLLQALWLLSLIIIGDIERLLLAGIVTLIFWLSYYFIWIGVHWVRWLVGGWNALSGFALVIWGMRDGAGLTVFAGVYSLGVGAYLGFAPAVYFFAKRQHETVRRGESLGIAGVFLLLLGSLTAGVLGLLGHKANLEREAREFADTAFKRIFAEHDEQFILQHASNRLLESGGGPAKLTYFLRDATRRAGFVHDIGPSSGSLRFWYLFPFRLGSEGQMHGWGVGRDSRVRMQLIIGEAGGPWQIHAIGWQPDLPYAPPPTP
jgi:hypothetical protein